MNTQPELNHFGGRWHAGEGRRMPVLNPATEQQLATAAAGTPEDVDAAVRSAREAFPGWREAGAQARAAALLDLAAVIDTHADELMQLESANVGKPLAVAREELPVCFRQPALPRRCGAHPRGSCRG